MVKEEDQQIDDQTFKNGLHCIGKTFNNSHHAFLSLSIPDQGLTTLNGVQRFIYL